MSQPMPDFLRELMARTPQQQACRHLLSSRMADGKYFCPSCHLVAYKPLVETKP
jgi:hypothetical protein